MFCVHYLGVLGRPNGDSRLLGYPVFGHPTCPRLPGELPGTSQLKHLPRVSLQHGGHSWKQQRPFKDKPRDDDDDDDDDDVHYVMSCSLFSFIAFSLRGRLYEVKTIADIPRRRHRHPRHILARIVARMSACRSTSGNPVCRTCRRGYSRECPYRCRCRSRGIPAYARIFVCRFICV